MDDSLQAGIAGIHSTARCACHGACGNSSERQEASVTAIATSTTSMIAPTFKIIDTPTIPFPLPSLVPTHSASSLMPTNTLQPTFTPAPTGTLILLPFQILKGLRVAYDMAAICTFKIAASMLFNYRTAARTMA